MDKITVVFPDSLGVINPDLYGHFSEHIGGVFYDGLWVGEDSPVENTRGFRKALVDSFRKICPPVLRWPGGCFAETYDWRDGIGPRAARPRRVNWWYSSDGRAEPNQVGTHEFMDLCGMVGAKPYVAANITSLTPLHIRDWVEYCNIPSGVSTLADERARNGHAAPFGVEYWGIGNENWGGGGQMSPERCAQEFLRYATVANSLMRDKLKFIICGANGHDIAWTRRLLGEWSNRPFHEAPLYGMSVHYYCGTAGQPQEYSLDEWYQLLFQADTMRRIVEDHRAAMDEFDPDRRIALIVDEWGCWHRDGSGPSRGANLFEQQSNMRDAVVAAMTLNTFNNHCDSVRMANVAQLCNNLHSLYLASGQNFVETPNYFVFDMFKAHQGAKQMRAVVECPVMERAGFAPLPDLSVSASEKDGRLTITMANLRPDASRTVSLSGAGRAISGKAALTVLASADPHTCNTFDDPRAVTPVTRGITLRDGDAIELPPASVACLTV